MNIFLIILVIIVLIYGTYTFNKLIRLRNMVNEAWSGIDVQLQKRYDLIPNIVKVVKGYALHEKKLFENITKLRKNGIQADNVQQQEAAEAKPTAQPASSSATTTTAIRMAPRSLVRQDDPVAQQRR
jgi:LemA protein